MMMCRPFKSSLALKASLTTAADDTYLFIYLFIYLLLFFSFFLREKCLDILYKSSATNLFYHYGLREK